jgi:hypothetical protein
MDMEVECVVGNSGVRCELFLILPIRYCFFNFPAHQTGVKSSQAPHVKDSFGEDMQLSGTS